MSRPRPSPHGHPTTRLVGRSTAIHDLCTQIRHLAAFDTLGNPYVPTLLPCGETGTGKGLVARIIHDRGLCARGSFIEVNCAAIPESLLEAELFGFEAGAFTDAKRTKTGLFEAASGIRCSWMRSMPSRYRCKASSSLPLRRNGCGAWVQWWSTLWTSI